MADRLLIAVVDDDASVRESLPDLLHEFGFKALVFESAEEFLDSDRAALTHTGENTIDPTENLAHGNAISLAKGRRPYK
ncbi:hypothetical protein [Cupriavidus necator]